MLAHFIRLAEATKNDNKPQMMISMEALGKNMSSGAPPSIFTSEVMQALAQTDVSVARMHVLCEDESVIGRRACE